MFGKTGKLIKKLDFYKDFVIMLQACDGRLQAGYKRN
jgi:hypothetical protein